MGRGTLRRLTASNNDQHQQQPNLFTFPSIDIAFQMPGQTNYFTERLGLF